MAWIWATESIKNCVNGKHEWDGDVMEFRDLGGNLILTYHRGHVVQLRTCKHCQGVFPE